MSLTLIDVAARLVGWRGPYLKYAFALTSSTMLLPAEYRPHLDRVIARRSGFSSDHDPSPYDPAGLARSKAIAWYTTATARRRDLLADYQLATAVHDLLQTPGVTVTARNAAGTSFEALRSVDLREGVIDIEDNSITIGRAVYTQVEVDCAAGVSVQSGGTPAKQRHPTMEDVLTGWFRDPNHGGKHRNSPNTTVRREFKKDHLEYKDRKVTKTTIGNARKNLGWAGRGRVKSAL